ncbi:MAG: rRNA pseudouridine synthase [Firmicutes bacterium]|nr:rRNA pseudouridine synthase [Bacillota bacterium]
MTRTEHPRRLDAVLAEAGLGSRQQVRRLIRQGRVTVNGRPERDPGRHVMPASVEIAVDGRTVELLVGPVTLMLYKPRGVVTATRDVRQPTVVDGLPPALRRRLFPAGRLDKDTEGLVILTDDGDLCHQIISPRHGVEKEYHVELDGPVNDGLAAEFAAGVRLSDGERARPARLIVLRSEAPAVARVVITEGRYHQVKRMFGAFGLRVTYLCRLRIGSLQLDPTLSPGDYRPLTAREIGALLVNPAAGILPSAGLSHRGLPASRPPDHQPPAAGMGPSFAGDPDPTQAH